MRIGAVLLQQRARESVEQIAHGLGLAVVGRRLQGQPRLTPIGKLSNSQRLDPCVFDDFDQADLQRRQGLHGQRPGGEHQMRGAVVGRSAIDVQRADDLL
ncbi:hypothetical protein GALL_475430 [mine drainage metagenome]|uniref:Uncharacterized protein n=1 Tax=mine drainage metagenome TaxID=410659 RepID=A0A1J5PGW1_9ZZZZ